MSPKTWWQGWIKEVGQTKVLTRCHQPRCLGRTIHLDKVEATTIPALAQTTKTVLSSGVARGGVMGHLHPKSNLMSNGYNGVWEFLLPKLINNRGFQSNMSNCTTHATPNPNIWLRHRYFQEFLKIIHDTSFFGLFSFWILDSKITSFYHLQILWKVKWIT